MTSRNRTLQTLVGLLSAGTLGISVILAPSSSKAMPATPERGKTPEASAVGCSVAARLQAIRDAVSTVAEEGADTGSGDPNILKTWWRNGGWGWGNGGRGWGNGGWGNWHGWRRW